MRVGLAWAVLPLGILAVGACFPDPSGDFETYAEDVKPFAQSAGDGGGTFDSAPPTEAVEGLFYGACVTQLAFGQPNDAFLFYTMTKFTPEPGGGGGRLQLSIQPIAIVNDRPPPTVSKAGTVGEVKDSGQPATPNVTGPGRYTADFGTVTIPGAANPITGRDAVIQNVRLVGHFGQTQFCARLNGQVTQPITLDLNERPDLNICQFRPIKDGDAPPAFTSDDFTPQSCPE